jgi:hypothetical protein
MTRVLLRAAGGVDVQRLRQTVLLLSAGVILALASPAGAVSKGHQILIDRGLQIQAQAFYQPQDLGLGSYSFNGQRYLDANYTSINWHYRPVNSSFANAHPNFPWARWEIMTGQADLTPAEQPYKSEFIALQYKDENSLNSPAVRADFRAWFEAARPNFPNAILYTNQLAFDATDQNLATYMSESRPDMLCMDSYRWRADNAEGAWHLLSDMQRYRKWGLRGHDGTGNEAIPYALYPQTFHGEGRRDPSESELRLNRFAAWALGYTYTSDFTFNYGTSSLFTPGYDTNNPTATYSHVREANRQGRNLGPALVRLVSRDVLFVPGLHPDGNGNGVTNPTPIDMGAYPASFNATNKDPWIRGVQGMTNLGTRNAGLRGDFLISWFQVLDESFDGSHSGEWYFMVTNALVDPTGSAAETRQRIQMNFANTVPEYLQRLNRDTGLVEDILLPIIPDSGGRRMLLLELDGGTADLFKFKTGAPFVPEPAALGLLCLSTTALLRRPGRTR